ncbi:MAG TPA: DUF3572 family protein [Sphingomicrobium sp.]|nr:DUF3572 family protein [Sphingomicrobium sp.]
MTAETPNDAHTIALAALTATLTDERRARRFLDLTGIGTDDLRRRVDDRGLLRALIGFLEAHEPDLVAVSEQIGLKPDELVAAGRTLETFEDPT